jgi:hypothetical protein
MYQLALTSIIMVSFVLANTSMAAEAGLERNAFFVQHQVGANQGFYSMGLGYHGNIFEPSFSFGYVPPVRGGAEVSQGNLKANWKIASGSLPDVQWLAGASLLVNSSRNTFFTVPKKYPRRYYPPNAYYFSLQTTLRHHGFYIELSTLDYNLEVAARNHISIDYIADLVSLGFGYIHPI